MSGTFDLAAGRVPAMFNGCVGVKPTVGRLSTLGVVPAARALDCVTVFSQNVADGAAVARLMEVRVCPSGRHHVVSSAGGQQRTLSSPSSLLRFACGVDRQLVHV